MTSYKSPNAIAKESNDGSLNSYDGFLDYISQLKIFGMKLELENITAVCKRLNNPQLSYKTIHIAGTNGKGSVTAMCSSILKQSGFKVGMYISPHLQILRERIQVNEEMISQDDAVKMASVVISASQKPKKIQLTHFEFLTAMAFVYFQEKKCDFAVIETGMGGRLDATNILKPQVAVITNIGIEHSKYLGNTKEKIAYEKGGIIKRNILVVIGEEDEKIKRLLIEICKNNKAKSIEVNEPYRGKVLLQGEYQKKNAAIASSTVKALKKSKITNKHIREGIAKTKWPGRLEIVQRRNPTVIIDSSHNPDGMKTSADYIRSLNKDVILVLGISDDKDIDNMIKLIAPLAKIIITTTSVYRGYDCKKLCEKIKNLNKKSEPISNVKLAVKEAIRKAKDKEVVFITGSLFVAGEARNIWFKEKP